MVSSQDNEELLHHILKNLANEQYKYQLYNNKHLARRVRQSQQQGGDVFDGDDEEDGRLEKVTIEVDADEFELKVGT